MLYIVVTKNTPLSHKSILLTRDQQKAENVWKYCQGIHVEQVSTFTNNGHMSFDMYYYQTPASQESNQRAWIKPLKNLKFFPLLTKRFETNKIPWNQFNAMVKRNIPISAQICCYFTPLLFCSFIILIRFRNLAIMYYNPLIQCEYLIFDDVMSE